MAFRPAAFGECPMFVVSDEDGSVHAVLADVSLAIAQECARLYARVLSEETYLHHVVGEVSPSSISMKGRVTRVSRSGEVTS